MTDRHGPDPMTLLAQYAPTAAALDREWAATRPADAVARIVAADVEDEPARLMPYRRAGHRRLGARVPVLVSVGVFGAAAAVLAVVLVTAVTGEDSDRSGVPAGGHGQPIDPPAGLSDKALGAKQYSYRVVEQRSLDRHGKQIADRNNPPSTSREYVATNGDVVTVHADRPGCSTVRRRPGDFSSPDAAFFAALPTGVPELTAYLRRRAEGSSSRDEAVFTQVGDLLSSADGLASPKVRAALVAVLSRTPGVFLHRDRDYLHHPALRLDFVNQRIRAGEVQSLYFDPTDFRLLEEREGGNGAPHRYTGPSPAYDSPAPANGVDPVVLGNPASISVLRSETVVARLPAACRHK